MKKFFVENVLCWEYFPPKQTQRKNVEWNKQSLFGVKKKIKKPVMLLLCT